MHHSINIHTLISAGSLFVAVCAAISSAITWYTAKEKKKYGIERDFAHLRRNQEQILQSVAELLKELDRRLDQIDHDILEIKSEFKNKP